MHSAEAPSAGADRSFSVSSRRLEDGILVALAGDVDLGTATVVDDELCRAGESESLIVLDLGEVSFMDSTGLRTVIAADQRLRASGGSLRIVNVPAQVSRLFELVGVSERLAIDGRFEAHGESPPGP
ncbi:MAG TPA: STAS domain-containing protein [Solirubrobacteraceae bacterium]|nr:STAS domain-containing protein [Solirubrobacteraceae bacterium]